MRIWTPEARAAQSALMHRLKPWKKSTGPRTAAGKAKAAKNSYKTGLHAKPMRQARKYFRQCRDFLENLKTEYYNSGKFLGHDKTSIAKQHVRITTWNGLKMRIF